MKEADALTSSAAMVTVWLVTITGKILAYKESGHARPRVPYKDGASHLAVGHRREQEDCRRKGAEEGLSRGEEVVPDAARTA